MFSVGFIGELLYGRVRSRREEPNFGEEGLGGEEKLRGGGGRCRGGRGGGDPIGGSGGGVEKECSLCWGMGERGNGDVTGELKERFIGELS